MRLFWKIFVTFGVAMTLTLVGAVIVSSELADQAFDQLNFEGRDRIIQEAAEALEQGGEWRLRLWMLRNPRPAPGMALLVIDERGNELLGRRPPPSVAKLLEQESFNRFDRPRNIRPMQLTPEIFGDDGQEYRLVFARAPVTFFGILTWPGTQVAVLTIALIAAALTSLLLASYVSAPIVKLQKATRELAAGALETRVGAPINRRRDETGRLARDFDAMAERLQALVMDKEALLRDVSHEFRSPLARIHVALALAERNAGDAAKAHLERIEQETEKLNALVEQVMTLTRLRTDAAPRREPVVLDELIQEIVDDARFEHSSATIAYSPARVPTILGDRAGLRSAIENVLRNALSHTGPEQRVDVRLDSDGNEIAVHVLDNGPGVPPEATQRIFEPFFRVDPSRDHQAEGKGIGLAITARVMELHGGRAGARNRPEGGLHVELALPIRPDGAA
ncbi:MAG: HAMP domain-containing protein [Gammaproteobacteria bacterium]|nr:HAMP domain-containing protein [Gammaproteobacteria bacterium]